MAKKKINDDTPYDSFGMETARLGQRAGLVHADGGLQAPESAHLIRANRGMDLMGLLALTRNLRFGVRQFVVAVTGSKRKN